MPPPQSQQPRTPSAAVASQHQQQRRQYDINTPYASYVHAQQQQHPQYFPMTSTSVTPNPAFQSPSLPSATPQTQQAQVLAKTGTPLQLYDSPSLPQRVQSQQQPRQQPQVAPERYQQQYQHSALRQQYRDRSLPQTPAQPIQSSTGKSGNSSRSGNSSGKSSFPKVEVQIFNRTPRKEDQNLHRPRSASPGKRPAPSAKRKSASLASEGVAEQPPDPSMDYQTLLLSLADEYLDAAHSQGATISATRKEEEIEEYYRLIATGLACFEAVLKTPRLSPSTEAIVRLRYALVLYEETDNDFETESTLTKGIDLCERNRFTDLKYTMQHILARVLFKSNPKAALKAVDSMVSEAEA
ncbi:hypothetical protein KEM55_003302 [Ascosphaera atra]|nr:hypothetical protein KEM55_003302 [Ascosphaera atra]